MPPLSAVSLSNFKSSRRPWTDAYQRRIESWCTRGTIPTALVAVSDGRVIGTVALKERELRQYTFTPWLAGLFVVPEFRRQGVGEQLVRAAECEAIALGVEALYLYTPQGQGFYERLGWGVIEHGQSSAGLVAVMSKALKPNPSFQPTAQSCALGALRAARSGGG